MQPLFLTGEYLRYIFKAKGAHGIHSAFVYELYNKVISDNRNYYEFQAIEHLRKLLLGSDRIIDVVDFGASRKVTEEEQFAEKTIKARTAKRAVDDIARLSSVSPKKGRLLFRLVNFLQPKVMVELGTSLGISTLYQYKACPEASFYTLEGSPQTAEVAAENFRKLRAYNIQQKIGSFQNTLPELLGLLPVVDYVFFDGNHRKDATLDYFKSFMAKASDNTVFVIDDIRWSREMYEAWNIIISETKVAVTIDLFTFGLVFFRKNQEKEHFVVRF